MIRKLIVYILFGGCIACDIPPSTNVQNEQSIKKDTVYIKEPIDVTLKEQVLNYKLYLDYASNTEWKLQNKHYSILHEWVNRFKKDSIINQLSSKEIDTTFIIHVEAGVSRNITPEIGRKRMGDVRRVISSMLGTNIDYDIEIIKVLRNLKYKEEHDIEIKINRLRY